MVLKNVFTLSFLFFLVLSSCKGQDVIPSTPEVVQSKTPIKMSIYNHNITLGADQLNEYIKTLSGKRVGVVANQTTILSNGTHLVDTLLSLGIDIKTVFSPEHGFRGKASAGEKVASGKDSKTGLPIVSLYGKHKKPTPNDLSNLDILVFDMQDVGARFYTYISTLHYVMEACAEQKKPLIVLDRPNPNGFYVDGPVLEKKYTSFVGMHPIPVVHGLTIGELAGMINNEGWLENDVKCDVGVVLCKNYSHKDLYKLPVAPSPNLPNMRSVYLYPSLCFFEGTATSIGRGTDFPFQVIGSPLYPDTSFSFIPKELAHAKSPKQENKECFGLDLRANENDSGFYLTALNLNWIIDFNEVHKEKEFITRTRFFDLLAGTDKLRKQLNKKISPKEIKNSWRDDLKRYKKMRLNYLLYPDFE